MRNPSATQHSFAQAPSVSVQRSRFKRPSTHKTTFDPGKLIPVFVDEILPGDTHKVDIGVVARLATPIVPVMDNVYMDLHAFFVPTRLIWENFQRFMGERKNPNDSIDFLVPQVELMKVDPHTIADYMGIPANRTFSTPISVNALPFRAYALIWNEWYRSQDLQNSVDVPKGDGPDPVSITQNLLPRAKRHDFFTSALPSPQKGPGVELSLGGMAVVRNHYPDSASLFSFDGGPAGVDTYDGYGMLSAHFWEQDGAGAEPVWDNNGIRSIGARRGDDGINYMTTANASTSSTAHAYFAGNYRGIITANNPDDMSDTGLYADLSMATAATINSLRTAFQIQRFLERDARGGTRYIEILRSHFGVISPDARLQRPEYLGGSTTRMTTRPVEQTSASSDGGTPQGNLAAFSTFGDFTRGATRSFVEHGYLIIMASVRADLTYQDGINRMWLRKNRLDFYWPEFAHLGEQAIENIEIFVQGTEDDSKVFGYQERHAEYRYKPSMVSGAMRSSHPQSLDVWHLAQHFENLPTLSAEFIEENPPIDRLIATPEEPAIIADFYFDQISVRPMPMFAVPGMIDHF